MHCIRAVKVSRSSSVVKFGSSICLAVTKLQSISQKMVSMDPAPRPGPPFDWTGVANMSHIHSQQLLLAHSQSLLPLNLMLHFTHICYFTFSLGPLFLLLCRTITQLTLFKSFRMWLDSGPNSFYPGSSFVFFVNLVDFQVGFLLVVVDDTCLTIICLFEDKASSFCSEKAFKRRRWALAPLPLGRHKEQLCHNFNMRQHLIHQR